MTDALSCLISLYESALESSELWVEWACTIRREKQPMTQVLADIHLPERLKGLTESVRVEDESGRTLGIDEPLTLALPGVAAARSPNSDAQLHELRKLQEGAATHRCPEIV